MSNFSGVDFDKLAALARVALPWDRHGYGRAQVLREFHAAADPKTVLGLIADKKILQARIKTFLKEEKDYYDKIQESIPFDMVPDENKHGEIEIGTRVGRLVARVRELETENKQLHLLVDS